MKWTNNATKELHQQLFAAIGRYSNDFLINAVNETYLQIGVDPITMDVIRFISRRTLTNLVLDIMVSTDHFEADAYWVDPQGKITITLT